MLKTAGRDTKQSSGAESRAGELDRIPRQVVSGSRMGLEKQKNGFGIGCSI